MAAIWETGILGRANRLLPVGGPEQSKKTISKEIA